MSNKSVRIFLLFTAFLLIAFVSACGEGTGRPAAVAPTRAPTPEPTPIPAIAYDDTATDRRGLINHVITRGLINQVITRHNTEILTRYFPSRQHYFTLTGLTERGEPGIRVAHYSVDTTDYGESIDTRGPDNTYKVHVMIAEYAGQRELDAKNLLLKMVDSIARHRKQIERLYLWEDNDGFVGAIEFSYLVKAVYHEKRELYQLDMDSAGPSKISPRSLGAVPVRAELTAYNDEIYLYDKGVAVTPSEQLCQLAISRDRCAFFLGVARLEDSGDHRWEDLSKFNNSLVIPSNPIASSILKDPNVFLGMLYWER